MTGHPSIKSICQIYQMNLYQNTIEICEGKYRRQNMLSKPRNGSSEPIIGRYGPIIGMDYDWIFVPGINLANIYTTSLRITNQNFIPKWQFGFKVLNFNKF
ncbi:MAG: hypothetical protein IPL25_10890 [Saprospiraceae bacterium]|nr:hypothetical protein [Candidatus Vicinibacter affinis]